MKKRSIFLTITGGMLALGIILIILGAAFGGRIHTFSIGEVKNTDKSGVSHELKGISLTDTTDIQNLHFKLSANEIKIQTGDAFRIQGGSLSKNEVSNGVWKVESYFSDHFFNVSIFGLKFPIPRGWSGNEEDEEIIITLPQNTKLEKVTLDLNATDVDIDYLDCNTLLLDLAAGDISVNTLFAEKADLSVSAGSMDIDNYQINGSATINCDAGGVDFGKQSLTNTNVCNNLTLDCSMGDITVNGMLTGENILDCSMGSITLNLAGGRNNYEIKRTSQSLGDISFNEKQPSSTDTIYGTLDLDCSMGDMNINYLGD